MSDFVSSLSDAQLLKRFSRTRCESAFQEIVERYGQLVMSVCRRALRNQHDAEDAFQATFLVLAEQAGEIKKRKSLPSWLCGVAYRLSMNLARKHHRKELALTAEPMAARDQFSDLEQRFDEQAMGEELYALPAKYRDVLIRFYFMGETSRQIAEALGITQGAANGRIARGRQELRVRLAKRGVALGAIAIAAFSAKSASASVAPTLVQSTVAAAIAKGPVGLVSPSVVKLAGTELMKTSSIILSIVVTSAVVALLGVGAFGLNLPAARAMAHSPRVDTRVNLIEAQTATDSREQTGVTTVELQATATKANADLLPTGSVTVGSRPRKEAALASPERIRNPKARLVQSLGLELAPIDRRTHRVISAKQLAGGLRVLRAVKGGVADKSGIRKGDILVGLATWETTNFKDLDYILRQQSTWNDQAHCMVVRADAKQASSLSVAYMPLAKLDSRR